MTRSRKEQIPPFSIPSNEPGFRLDKSQLPADKLDDPRLAEWEEALLKSLQHVSYRQGVCVHEAGHALYMERAGACRVTLHAAVALYDPQNDEFEFGAAGVRGNFGQQVQIDILIMARWYAAGGVAKRLLIGGDDWGEAGGDQADFRVFSGVATDLGQSADQISELWEQAKRDVETDLRSPAFRRQLWDRAREIEQQLLEMIRRGNAANADSLE
jgi:hypothetical protein